MSKEQTITISVGYYEQLLEYEKKLDALENFGVDNWGGYGDAMQSLEEDDD